MKLHVVLGLAGICLILAGVAWIYPPAALIVAGAVLISAYQNIEKGNANARKPE